MRIEIKTNVQANDTTFLIPFLKGPALKKQLEDSVLSDPLAWSDEFEREFKAESKEYYLFTQATTSGWSRFLFLGLGAELDFGKIQLAFRSLVFKQRARFGHQLVVDLRTIVKMQRDLRWLEAAVNGIALARYRLALYKTTPPEEENCPFLQESSKLTLIVPSELLTAAEEVAHRAQIIAETQMRIFDLVNAPANKKTAEILSEWAINSGKQYQYSVKVLDKAAITELGMNALLAVNQGSPDPATFNILEYRPNTTKELPKIGLVGKGVTFDTGGLSIKPSGNMHYMKSDMGGAAAVFGALEVCARLQVQAHVIGIVPATDNSVDAHSVKPSDVIRSYSGKTIEIIDTDAEGRLILADGLAYMVQHFQPEILIDLATLTGSSIRTFGYHTGALFSNNDELSQQLIQAGQACGERLWQLPIWEEYFDMMKSDIADIKNFSGKPIAGAITAAKFLEFFTDNHPRWAHLDIAGVAVWDSEFGTQKTATAYGVRLLLEYIEQIASSED